MLSRFPITITILILILMQALRFALEMQRRAALVVVRGAPLRIRVGLHSGAVVGGVLGTTMPQYRRAPGFQGSRDFRVQRTLPGWAPPAHR